MDYEVFILTRINEEYEITGNTNQAVIRGLGHTGLGITSGALIPRLAFIALGGVPVTDVKILSTGLAAGIIIDATITVFSPPHSSPCSATTTGGSPHPSPASCTSHRSPAHPAARR